MQIVALVQKLSGLVNRLSGDPTRAETITKGVFGLPRIGPLIEELDKLTSARAVAVKVSPATDETKTKTTGGKSELEIYDELQAARRYRDAGVFFADNSQAIIRQANEAKRNERKERNER